MNWDSGSHHQWLSWAVHRQRSHLPWNPQTWRGSSWHEQDIWQQYVPQAQIQWWPRNTNTHRGENLMSPNLGALWSDYLPTTFECIFLLLSFFLGGAIVGILRFIIAGGESTDELAWGLRRILGARAIAESLEKLLVKEVRKKKWDRVIEWNRVIEWRSGYNFFLDIVFR